MADFIYHIQRVVEHFLHLPADYWGLGQCVTSVLAEMLRGADLIESFPQGFFSGMQPKRLNTWLAGTVKLDLQPAFGNKGDAIDTV